MDVEEDRVVEAFKLQFSGDVDFDVFLKELFGGDEACAACWAVVGQEVPSVGLWKVLREPVDDIVEEFFLVV